MTQKAKKLAQAAQAPSGDTPYDELRGRVSDEFLKSLSNRTVVKCAENKENFNKVEKFEDIYDNKTMNLSDEEKIRSFIINELNWPSEKANILAPQWAKAHNFQDDVEKRTAKSVIALPEKPMREIRNRENIVEYLRSAEGFGPWIEAGALTRPLLRSISPKAYQSLVNWLRNNELPADIQIPTLKEVNDRALATPGTLREARRLVAANARR